MLERLLIRSLDHFNVDRTALRFKNIEIIEQHELLPHQNCPHLPILQEHAQVPIEERLSQTHCRNSVGFLQG
jgi:hypothetical protein